MPDSHFSLALIGATLLTYSVARANIILDTDRFGNFDGRGSITELASILGLSEDEVSRIRASTGYVVCPGTENGNGAIMSAVVVGSGMQIATAAHAFIAMNGVNREPLAECYFRTQEPEPTSVPLDFSGNKYINGAVPGEPRTGDNAEEWAVVALQRPIPGATPFIIEIGLPERSEVIAVSAYQVSPTREFSSQEPVIQACRKRAQVRTILFLDCDLSEFGSGGPILTKNRAGDLVFQGIMVTSGAEHLNYSPFSLSTGSYTVAIAPLDEFRAAIESIAAELQAGSREP